ASGVRTARVSPSTCFTAECHARSQAKAGHCVRVTDSKSKSPSEPGCYVCSHDRSKRANDRATLRYVNGSVARAVSRLAVCEAAAFCALALLYFGAVEVATRWRRAARLRTRRERN